MNVNSVYNHIQFDTGASLFKIYCNSLFKFTKEIAVIHISFVSLVLFFIYIYVTATTFLLIIETFLFIACLAMAQSNLLYTAL